ncbi:MAG: glycoside hydrolase family protein, partial [Planctomycetota bacterium]
MNQAVIGLLLFLLLTTPALGAPSCPWDRTARDVIGLAGADHTITVAASDTDSPAWARVDFVCDGVRDQVEIQAAIDALPLAGGTVRLLAGHYSVEENGTNQYCIIIDRSDIKFAFEDGAVIKLADNVFAAGETGHVLQVGSGLQAPPPLRTNITIWGPGTIDGNRANNAGGATTTSNAGIHVRGQITDLTIGGGLNLTRVRGVALGLTGVSVGGDPLSPYLLRCVRLVDIQLTDSGEGTLLNLIDGMIVDGLVIDNMIDQDGWEPLGVHNLLMTNSIMKNC